MFVDTLTICYEKSEECTYLLVSRDGKDRNEIVNKYEDEAAEELYGILIGK